MRENASAHEISGYYIYTCVCSQMCMLLILYLEEIVLYSHGILVPSNDLHYANIRIPFLYECVRAYSQQNGVLRNSNCQPHPMQYFCSNDY